MQISVSELKANAGKYVTLADKEDIYITKNGRRIAKLSGISKDDSLQALRGCIPSDVNMDRLREERIHQ